MPHVVVAGKLHDAGLSLLDAAPGATYDYIPSAEPTEYLSYLPQAEGLVLRTQPLTAANVGSAPSLKIVSRHGVGYDAVDVDALDRRGIPLAVVGDINSRTVAEHTMMLILALSRRMAEGMVAVKRGDWAYRNAFAPREIDGKTLLIVGHGRIGKRVGALASAFGMEVLVFDPAIESAGPGFELVSDLGTGLAQCDVLTVHVPGGGEALIGAAELARMKPEAVVVNTARGGIIDEAALLAALKAGRLAGAALDVLAMEPPEVDNPLLDLPNVIVTPHCAGLTMECAQRMAVASVQNVLDHFEGRLSPHLVVNLRSGAPVGTAQSATVPGGSTEGATTNVNP